MNWFAWLRIAAWMKRGVLALERIALANESTAQIALERQQHLANLRTRARRIHSDDDPITTFETLDQDAANKLWDRMRAERGEDVQ